VPLMSLRQPAPPRRQLALLTCLRWPAPLTCLRWPALRRPRPRLFRCCPPRPERRQRPHQHLPRRQPPRPHPRRSRPSRPPEPRGRAPARPRRRVLCFVGSSSGIGRDSSHRDSHEAVREPNLDRACCPWPALNRRCRRPRQGRRCSPGAAPCSWRHSRGKTRERTSRYRSASRRWCRGCRSCFCQGTTRHWRCTGAILQGTRSR
jgi:hypothetical protein